MTDKDRIDRLEGKYEKLYHEVELLNLYIPKIADVLIKYFPAMAKYRRELENLVELSKGDLEQIDNEVQDHFKFHLHIDKKKRKYLYEP